MVENEPDAGNLAENDATLRSSWRGQTVHDEEIRAHRMTRQDEEREFHKDMAQFVNDHHCKIELLKN